MPPKTKLEILILIIRIYKQDSGMKFEIEKCAMVIMKRREKKSTGRNRMDKSRMQQNT